MKVFLSHSTKDKAFVQTLAQHLQAEHIEPWLCEVDVLVGEDFVEQIEQGLREADLTIVVWSPDAAQSKWTGKEWRSVLAREIEESRTRLGLILLHDAIIPELLRTKHRIDGSTNQEQAMQETVAWLVRQRDMRRYESTGAANFVVDFEPTDFVGRTAYIEQLHEALVEERGKFLLWGGPGCGKSTLALKFAWRARGAFDAVVFQHCGQRPVEVIGNELAERLNLDLGEVPPEQQIKEINKWVCQRRTLLVLDDIWNADIKALIPAPPLSVASLSLLCTSRQRSFPWVQRPRTMEIKAFTEEEAEILFRIWLGDETVDSLQEDLRGLANRLERLPIAVAVAAEMLSRQFGPLDEEAKDLQLARLRNEIHDVPSLLQEAINSQGSRERRLLQAMAVCYPEDFWFPLAAKISGLGESVSGQSRDQLVNASLVGVVDQYRQRFRLHVLLREQLLRSVEVETLKQRHADILLELFKDWETRPSECRECLHEIISANQFLWGKGLIGGVEWLSFWGFKIAQRGGNQKTGLDILQQVERFLIGSKDVRSNDMLQGNYGNQAVILYNWGKYTEAMSLLKKQAELCETGHNKIGLSRSFGTQALILKEWGKPIEALKLLKAQEKICKELGGNNDLANCLNNQALALRAMGRRHQAMEILTENEKLCEKLSDKAGLMACYANQAVIFDDWGKLKESMTLQEKVERICLELGIKPGLMRCYGNKSRILMKGGHLREAMDLLREQEKLCKELGFQRDLGLCFLNWGRLARELDKPDEAKEKLNLALEIFARLQMPGERDAVQQELERFSE